MTLNPVIPGFHPDPSVCRVGDDYYLACSSFEYFPGVPIFHSRDLVNWTQIGNILDRPSQLPLHGAEISRGIYAPTLRYHDGTFWMITTNTSGVGHIIVTAEDPAGPWSEPVVVTMPGGKERVLGIDPDLAWDDDGTCWCTYADPDESQGSRVAQVRINPQTGEALEQPRLLWQGVGMGWPEAPHLYRIGQWWYLLIAEGGTSQNHAVSIARAKTPDGPFEGNPNNPIHKHRSSVAAVRNVGHADLFEGPDGSWWLVALGVRPHGGFPAWHVLGRETFLTPVHWEDEWPVAAPVTLEIDGLERSTSDDAEVRDTFDDTSLAHVWVSARERPESVWSLTERPGWLQLHANGQSLDDLAPAFIGRRQQHLNCLVRASVDVSAGRGGLVIRMDEDHHYEVEATATDVTVRARIGPLEQTLATQARHGSDPVVLGIRCDAASVPESVVAPPDVVQLGVDKDGEFTALATLDGRYLSTEVAGGFTGRIIGMYATEGSVAFDWFSYKGTD